MDIDKIHAEIEGYYESLENMNEGEHIWESYQHVVSIMLRVGHIRSEIAWLEVKGSATPAEKKFRTMILDPFIERLQEVARYESRKITAKALEANMEK